MGFVCELLVSGALTATFSIKAGVEAPPDRVCTGAAMVAASESPVGTKIISKLTQDGVAEGKPVTMERLPNTAEGNFNFRESLPNGKFLQRDIHPTVMPMMKAQVAKDTSPMLKR